MTKSVKPHNLEVMMLIARRLIKERDEKAAKEQEKRETDEKAGKAAKAQAKKRETDEKAAAATEQHPKREPDDEERKFKAKREAWKEVMKASSSTPIHSMQDFKTWLQQAFSTLPEEMKPTPEEMALMLAICAMEIFPGSGNVELG